jgi:hypothetical protein
MSKILIIFVLLIFCVGCLKDKTIDTSVGKLIDIQVGNPSFGHPGLTKIITTRGIFTILGGASGIKNEEIFIRTVGKWKELYIPSLNQVKQFD